MIASIFLIIGLQFQPVYAKSAKVKTEMYAQLDTMKQRIAKLERIEKRNDSTKKAKYK